MLAIVSGRRCLILGAVGVVIASVTTPTNAVQAASSVPFATGSNSRLSVSAIDGAPGDNTSTRPTLSEDGHWATFQSTARNLVVEDQRVRGSDVYYANTDDPAHTMRRVSVDGTTGGDADGDSTFSDVSGDGHYVVFTSSATDIVRGRKGFNAQIYLRDMWAGVATVISVAPSGALGTGGSHRPTISADGRFVTWNSLATNLVGAGTAGPNQIFLRDLTTSQTILLSRGAGGVNSDGENLRPQISSNGVSITWQSKASNLVAAGGASPYWNVYQIGNPFLSPDATPSRVSNAGPDAAAATDGASVRPSTSGNGRYVVFQSKATNLVTGDTNGLEDLFVWDATTGAVVRPVRAFDGAELTGSTTRGSMDYAGGLIAFVSTSGRVVRGDRNHRPDVFALLWNDAVPKSKRITVASDGGEASCAAATSADDPYASRSGEADDDATADDGAVTMAARPTRPDISTRPYLSSDGRRVVFVSGFCNLVTTPPNPGAINDVYLRVSGP